jgi:hypothetical protein
MFATGAISFNALHNYFGTPQTLSLNQLYRGQSYIYNTPQNAGIPTSGAISLINFVNSYNYSFDITTIMTNVTNLVNSIPTDLEMPPYGSDDHYASFYWSGSSWVLISQDSYGSGDVYFNTMQSIFPEFFNLFSTITGGGQVPTGNGNNVLGVGTLYTSVEGFTINGTQSYGYGDSESMTFNYLGNIIKNLTNSFVTPAGLSIQSIINGINFAGSRAQFLAGIQSYVNNLYAN